MTMHFLEVVGNDGKRADYTGPLGSTNFEHGLSTEAADCELWEVQRIIRPEDGGSGIGMTVAIVRDETSNQQGPGEDPPPAPPPFDHRDHNPELAQPRPDRMAAARAAKAARRAGHDPKRGSGGN